MALYLQHWQILRAHPTFSVFVEISAINTQLLCHFGCYFLFFFWNRKSNFQFYSSFDLSMPQPLGTNYAPKRDGGFQFDAMMIRGN